MTEALRMIIRKKPRLKNKPDKTRHPSDSLNYEKQRSIVDYKRNYLEFTWTK